VLGWLILAFFALAFIGLLAWRQLVGNRKPDYLAFCEYWIYVTEPQLPPQEKLMDRMISSNPHNRRGKPSIGAREGMLFTDIRTHIAVVRRDKNPHVFRPDLLHEDVEPTPEILALLPKSQGFIKVRYSSEAILRDNRHLQFIPHFADTVGEQAGGLVVFDPVMEMMWTYPDFHAMLAANNNTERPDFHLRVLWKREEDSCFAITRGLRKVGVAEWRVGPVECDEEVLVVGLLIRAAQRFMRNLEDSGPYEFEEYGHTFILTLTENLHDGMRPVTLHRRMQA
jgi:hypothetical protein